MDLREVLRWRHVGRRGLPEQLLPQSGRQGLPRAHLWGIVMGWHSRGWGGGLVRWGGGVRGVVRRERGGRCTAGTGVGGAWHLCREQRDGGAGDLDRIRRRHGTRAVLEKGNERKKGFAAPKQTRVHGDALCFMVETWARHKTREGVLNNGWRLVAVGGGWRLAVGGWWSLRAILNKKNWVSYGQPCTGLRGPSLHASRRTHC